VVERFLAIMNHVQCRAGGWGCQGQVPQGTRAAGVNGLETKTELPLQPAVIRRLKEAFSIRRASDLIRLPKQRRRNVADHRAGVDVIQNVPG